ncbi:MAG: sensor histidine kinase [Candidatus Promineifilaceae bacterium]
MNTILSWLKRSLTRVILIALLSFSVIPILIVSILFTSQSMRALTAQMEANLLQLASARAEEINIRLNEVANTTQIAAHQAVEVLETPIDDEIVTTELMRYQLDNRGILGLDDYYNRSGGADSLGDTLSNVYWASADVDATVAKTIIQTEQLDTIFEGIKGVSPDTQWIYMTTPEGMMRLYPWASNDHYPDAWDPTQIVFYTVAEPANNPSYALQWTAPYVDFAGAGWMVTASKPLIGSGGDFLGIMSHDVTIGSLKEIALNIQVLEGAGHGFLIDHTGGIIAHPDFQDNDATKGEQEAIKLQETGSAEFRQLVNSMLSDVTGLGYYNNDTNNDTSLLVYAPIEATGWRLGITVPREEVVAPAIQMRMRVLFVTLFLVILASALAIYLTQLIHRPIAQLLQGVQQVSADNKADKIQVNSFDELVVLANAFNEMSGKVWERETDLKEQVAALHIKINHHQKKERLDAIVETDFFKRLELNVTQLRESLKPSTA